MPPGDAESRGGDDPRHDDPSLGDTAAAGERFPGPGFLGRPPVLVPAAWLRAAYEWVAVTLARQRISCRLRMGLLPGRH